MDPQERWKALVEELSARTPGTGPGQMFGVPCLKRDGRMAACLWRNEGIAVKLVDPVDREAALALEGAEPFDPGMGRKMREWVHVPAAHGERWEELLERSLTTLPTG